MAPRPKNPPPDRRQEILEAALQVFAAKGYAAATNADIAREAGVTAAALYYYFPSKADLFKAVLTQRRSAILPNVAEMADQLLELPPEMVLPNVVQMMTNFLSDERTVAIIRIVLAESSTHPEVREVYQTQVMGEIAPLMLKYFKHQMELGRMREMDPRLMAVLIIGPIIAGLILRDVIKVDLAQDVTTEMLAGGIIDTLLPGIIVSQKE
ncbi:MAG TPA: TetR/AcrR family transcriptional regulator [Symbiobacteriaceae bacterium]|jgi:AcrR family transcriptional regulator|nr:TetR/AcrR family transcriptional regulator [Symbiobacteriaceae bacterium]